MRKPTSWGISLAVAMLLTFPGLVWAQMQTQSPPTDELGIVAWNTMHAHSIQHDLPMRSDYSTSNTTNVVVAGGVMSVTYGASDRDSAWTLESYEWRPDVKIDRLATAKGYGSGSPSDPNPMPPNPNVGTPGDTYQNSFRLADWWYTAKYTFRARYGVLGWHLDSLMAEYKPVAPPGPPPSEEK